MFLALLAGAGVIYAISRRAPVSSRENVNDSAEVVINPVNPDKAQVADPVNNSEFSSDAAGRLE